MSSLFNQAQCQVLKGAWHNFRTVITSFGLSDQTILLLFHANNLLSKLENPPVDKHYVDMVTQRVNQLATTSLVVLDIDDMLNLINDTLVQVSSTNLTKTCD